MVGASEPVFFEGARRSMSRLPAIMVVLRVKTVAPLGPLPAATPSVSERRCDCLRRLLPTGELAYHRAAELPQMPCAFLGEDVQHVATPSTVHHSVNHRQPGHAIALSHLALSAG